MSGIYEIKAMRSFIRLCGNGWELGYHERNGGNASLRLTAGEAALMEPFFSPRDWVPLPLAAPSLSGALFIVTGSGKFMRDAALEPEENVCVIELDALGERFRVLWGLTEGGAPTSELCSHLLCHEAVGGSRSVIYHCHPPCIIALSYILPLEHKAFTDALWRSMTECPIAAPRGVGVLPWIVPGSVELGRQTSALLKRYDAAVCACHGLFCAGKDCGDALGMAHTLEKSADIYLRILSSGAAPLRSITGGDLRALSEAYSLDLNGEFLWD